MFYTLQITAESESDMTPRLHRPCSLETLTGRKENVTDEEIDMVADAFKQQIKQLLQTMIKT